MQGIILINSYYDAPEAMYQPRRLAEAFRALGVPVRILRGDELPLRLVGGALAGKPQADFCIFLDKDKYRMRALEQAGMRLFNRREVIEALSFIESAILFTNVSPVLRVMRRVSGKLYRFMSLAICM